LASGWRKYKEISRKVRFEQLMLSMTFFDYLENSCGNPVSTIGSGGFSSVAWQRNYLLICY